MNNEVIKEINKVDGFDPSQMLKVYDDNSEPYLEVPGRLIWFRLKYPEGSIQTELESFENSMAIVKATILNNNEVIATAHGTAFLSEDNEYGLKAIECAETAAVGRALAYAGFGTQYCSNELGTPERVDGATPEAPEVKEEKETTKPKNRGRQPKAEKEASDEKATEQSAEEPTEVDVKTVSEKVLEMSNEINPQDAKTCVISFGPFTGKYIKNIYQKDADNPCELIAQIANPDAETIKEVGNDPKALKTIASAICFLKACGQ